MKTNPQILESVLGWPEGSIEKTVIKPTIPLKTVYAAMNAVRAEIKQKIEDEINKLDHNHDHTDLSSDPDQEIAAEIYYKAQRDVLIKLLEGEK